MWQKTVGAVERVSEIKNKRTGLYIMQRLRKGREKEIEMDVKDVQKNMSLIRSPAAGLKERKAKEAAQEAAMMEDDDENIQYVDAKLLERQLAQGAAMDSDSDEEMLAEEA